MLRTYDNGIASVFETPTLDATNVFVNHIGVLKDIQKLNYGPMHTPIIIFRCEWMKMKDNWRNPTYVRDDVIFLTMNFQHKLPFMFEPFIFPSQVTHVFFFNDLKKLGWKVVLWKEICFRKKIIDIKYVFITTIMEGGGLSAPIGSPPPPSFASLIGAKLSNKDNFLSFTKF